MPVIRIDRDMPIQPGRTLCVLLQEVLLSSFFKLELISQNSGCFWQDLKSSLLKKFGHIKLSKQYVASGDAWANDLSI